MIMRQVLVVVIVVVVVRITINMRISYEILYPNTHVEISREFEFFKKIKKISKKHKMSEGDSKEDEKKTQVALDEKDIALLKTYVSESFEIRYMCRNRRTIVRARGFFRASKTF